MQVSSCCIFNFVLIVVLKWVSVSLHSLCCVQVDTELILVHLKIRLIQYFLYILNFSELL